MVQQWKIMLPFVLHKYCCLSASAAKTPVIDGKRTTDINPLLWKLWPWFGFHKYIRTITPNSSNTAHLEQQAGVLASLSLQQCPLSCSGPEHQAKVPWRGDGHVILQVPPEGTVTQEAMWVWHHWGGRWEKDTWRKGIAICKTVSWCQNLETELCGVSCFCSSLCSFLSLFLFTLWPYLGPSVLLAIPNLSFP